MSVVKGFISKKNNVVLQVMSPIKMEQEKRYQEMNVIQFFPSEEISIYEGIGGAITPSVIQVFSSLTKENQNYIIEQLFSSSNLNLNSIRIPIGSCDFSSSPYSYDLTNYKDLSKSIEKLEKGTIDFIKAVNKKQKHLWVMASPWSPPAIMKTNKKLTNGGHLRKDCYTDYAEYILIFIRTLQKHNINIDMLSIQNEPMAKQKWESCLFNAQEEKVFLEKYLYPTLHDKLKKAPEICIWDHNKDGLFDRVRTIIKNNRINAMIDGLAFHWYSGDHFENLSLCKKYFPDKKLIFTESCIEMKNCTTISDRIKGTDNEWSFGQLYAHELIGDFNHGLNRFLDWNLLLQENGGPNHAGNFCYAPIMYDRNNNKCMFKSPFYVLFHFSHFIPVNSYSIVTSQFSHQLEVCSFKASNNRYIVIVQNPTNVNIPFYLKNAEKKEYVKLNAQEESIATYIIDKELYG